MNKFIYRFLFGKSNKLYENIILCLAITLACSFGYYDRYNSFMEFGRIILAILIFVIWVVGAFSSGKSKQWGFLIFTGTYWLLPHLYMLYYNTRDNVRGYNKYLSLTNKISDILVNKPFEFISENTGEPTFFYLIILTVIVCSAYFIGANLKALFHVQNMVNERDED